MGCLIISHCVNLVLGQAQRNLRQNNLAPRLDHIDVQVEHLFHHYYIPVLTGIPVEMRFEGGHHNSSEIQTVLKLRISARVKIQTHKTTIQGQNMGPIFIIQYKI